MTHILAAIKTWQFGVALVASIVAVSEAFLGQMLIALIVALIGATPPTIAIVLMAKKQSEERRVAQEILMREQQKMAENLDGKLDRLSRAETGQAKAEGIIEGGAKEKARADAEPVAPISPFPTEIKIVNKKSEAVPTIPGIDTEVKPVLTEEVKPNKKKK